MAKMMTNNELVWSMAEDLQKHCNWCSCYEETEDDNGNLIYTNICPFLDRDDDPTTALCLIGDPSTWNL